MDYWYDIVKGYDEPKSKDPKKKSDGTYSQSSVVILLIYLTFGEDHPYSIAKHFKARSYKLLSPDVEIQYNDNLRTTKVGTLLNKMKEDELVNCTENIVKGKLTKTYSINPRIIQSPIRSGPYFMRDGSTLEIPVELIEGLLAWKNWMNEESKPLCDRNEFFKVVVYPDAIDYLLFLEFIQTKAHYQQTEIDQQRMHHGPGPLEQLLSTSYNETFEYRKRKDELSNNKCEEYFNPFTGRIEEIPPS